MTDTWPPPPKITLKPGAMEELQRRRAEAALSAPQCGYGRKRAAAARAAALPPPGYADVPVMCGTSVQIAVLCLPIASTMDRESVAWLRRKAMAAFDSYYQAVLPAPPTPTTETP